MPLVRSSGNIPMDIDREAANTTLTIDEGACGDTLNTSNTVRRPRTRQQARREDADDNRVRSIVNDSLRDFREEISYMITEGLRNLTLPNTGQVQQDRRPEQTTSRQEHHEDTSIYSRDLQHEQGNHRFPNNNHDHDRKSDKTLNIIRNWRIRFTGDITDINVDEFIYRVNALTNTNLRADFQLLCEHAHLLFEGKALTWFWRFHRSCDDIDWDDLCDALKRQFKDYTTDFDLKDDILRRKQKTNESFDDFYDAIMVLCDRLRVPLTEYELCEIIQRNLRSEVRHELLHLDINRIVHLRRAVRRHEKFIKDTSSYFNKRNSQKGHVSEISEEDNKTVEGDSLPFEEHEICLVVKTGTCWNCDKPGHSFIDCLEPRAIFCYGCGTKNIYKPKCSNCSRKRENLLKDVRLKKDGHPKQN